MIGAIALGWRLVLFFSAGVGAGIANGVAGGGTFITFPTLLALGIPALQANISASVGIVPSSLGSLRVFREQLRPHGALLRALIPWCLLGAATGCTLLLAGSPSTFRSVVPWLIGAGTLLFALSPFITSRLAHVHSEHRSRRVVLVVGVFLISIYGGYFGAGIGILLLAVMALALPYDIYELQGLRNALSLAINVCAALIFVVHGHLAVQAVLMLLVGTLLGGWLGALLIVRLSPRVVRVLVIAAGVVTTVKLAIH